MLPARLGLSITVFSRKCIDKSFITLLLPFSPSREWSLTTERAWVPALKDLLDRLGGERSGAESFGLRQGLS